MENNSRHVREAIAKEHSISRFNILSRLIKELDVLKRSLDMNLVPKNRLYKHMNEIKEVEECIKKEKIRIKSISEVFDKNALYRKPINKKFKTPKYKCIENYVDFEKEYERAAYDDPFYNSEDEQAEALEEKCDKENSYSYKECSEEEEIDICDKSSWKRLWENSGVEDYS